MKKGRARNPLDILPLEVWMTIMDMCDISSLLNLKDTCTSFKQWTKPHLIKSYFTNYPILWNLFKCTSDKFVELNQMTASTSSICPEEPSTSSTSHNHHHHHLNQYDIPVVEKHVTIAPLNSPSTPATTIPIDYKSVLNSFKSYPFDPFILKVIHLMHKNINVIVDDLLASTSSSDDHLDTLQSAADLLLPTTNLENYSNFNINHVSSVGGSSTENIAEETTTIASTVETTITGSGAAEMMEGVHEQVLPQVLTGAINAATTNQGADLIRGNGNGNSSGSSNGPPPKYTDRYELWVNYDISVTGIDREANYQWFRSEVGRRGSGVLSREYVQWENTRRDLMRKLAILVAKVWSIIGQRMFPFSHAENKSWKERRKRKTVEDGQQHQVLGRQRSNSAESRHYKGKQAAGRRRIKSQNFS